MTLPRPVTPAECEAFLAEPRVAVLSVADGGRPRYATPAWYAYEPGGMVIFFTGTQSRRSRKGIWSSGLAP